MWSVLFLAVCFLETYSVLLGNIWISKNFASGPECSVLPSTYAVIKVLQTSQGIRNTTFSSFFFFFYLGFQILHLCTRRDDSGMCLERWSNSSYNMTSFYLRLNHTCKLCCCGCKERAKPPLRARGALRVILVPYIYCKWKEVIWCGIQ